MKRRGIIILISDFNAPDYSREARLTARRHDLIPVVITDRFERALPEARDRAQMVRDVLRSLGKPRELVE